MKKYVIVPAALLIYTCVMAYIGFPYYKNGTYSAFYYFGIVAASIAVDILLFFFMRKRAKLKEEREKDLK